MDLDKKQLQEDGADQATVRRNQSRRCSEVVESVMVIEGQWAGQETQCTSTKNSVTPVKVTQSWRRKGITSRWRWTALTTRSCRVCKLRTKRSIMRCAKRRSKKDGRWVLESRRRAKIDHGTLHKKQQAWENIGKMSTQEGSWNNVNKKQKNSSKCTSKECGTMLNWKRESERRKEKKAKYEEEQHNTLHLLKEKDRQVKGFWRGCGTGSATVCSRGVSSTLARDLVVPCTTCTISLEESVAP